MSMTVTANLAALGLDLPKAAAPAANYVPYVISGNQLFIAGQIPFLNGQTMHLGRLGEDLTVEQGIEAAKACALNILAQVNAAVEGDWTRVRRCVKLGGFVNCTPDFTDHPKVINGASDLMVAVLGDIGKHARFAVGAPSLPLGVAVEIDAIFEIS
ncbi:MAG: RidA family protein [Rhodospirillales bacterium]|nr:RidA family protein [Rhodospirillales bacterium]MCB9996076.1 RidA family protein [Rhodospirillales bacterium]